MSLRYSATASIIAGVLGGLLIVVGLMGELVLVVTGVLFVVFAVLMRFNVIAVVQDGQLQVKNPLGMTLKRFPVAGPADLRVEGKKVVHVATGKKVTSLGFPAEPADAASWRTWLAGASA